MIRSLKHKGLRRLYETGDARHLKQDQIARITRVLGILDQASSLDDIGEFAGLRLHGLKGELAGFWSVWISGNWRVIFRFENGEPFDVDLVDYH